MDIYEIFLGGEYVFLKFITREFQIFSLSNLSLALMLSVAVVLFVLIKSYTFKLMPGFFQSFIEQSYCSVYDFVSGYCHGYEKRYAKYLTGLFFYVLILNLLNLLPFLCEITSQIFISITISGVAILSLLLINIYEHGIGFYKQFLLDVPAVMKPFLFVMEFLLFLLKIVTLALRMSVAIGIGHFLLMIMSNLVIDIPWAGPIIVFFLSSIIMLVEIAVAFLQTYIFMLFICLTISDMLKKH